MVNIKNPVSFSDFLKNVSPLTPLNDASLKDAKVPKLIYRKKQIKCDLTGKKSSELALEKIFSTMQEQLNSYSVQIVSGSEAPRLDTLLEIVRNQTAAYKKKHWRITLFFKSLIYGDIDKLSTNLMDTINVLQTLPQSRLEKRKQDRSQLPADQQLQLEQEIDEDNKKKVATARFARNEFQTTEKKFHACMDLACKNLAVLIELKTNPLILSSHPLFKAEGDPSLETCLTTFENMRDRSEEILSILEKDPIAGKNDVVNDEPGMNRRIARLYLTDEFEAYVKSVQEASAYYLELSALIKDLGEKNAFDQEELNDLHLPLADPGFERTSAAKLSFIQVNYFAPVMQRVLRHEMLMKALLENVPETADEYDVVLGSVKSAENYTAAVDFQKYDKIRKLLRK